MTDRVKDIVQRLSAHSEEAIVSVLDQLKTIEDLSAEEKTDLSEALTAIFYYFRHSDSPTMVKLAIRTEKRIAKFGIDVIPFLFKEILEADGESLAYLGKALSKIGNPGLDHILAQWKENQNNDSALINMAHALSYFKVPEVKLAIPLLLDATKKESAQLTSMLTVKYFKTFLPSHSVSFLTPSRW
jgi:hypothetical protein